jgi:nucleotide-binding universal stress UspA family protein
MKLFERVLVAVGPGEAGLDLVRYARDLAGLLADASFSFVHVLGWSKEILTHAEAVARLHRAVAGHFDSTTAPCMVIHGVVLDRLLETAADTSADLILVGHARQDSGRRSLARRLAMQSPCSVWMKPFQAPSGFRRVLAAIDYSEPSAYALSVAGYLARRAGSIECRALHVASCPADPDRERAEFDRFAAPLDTAAVAVEPLFVQGREVSEAVRSIPSDLVVMGARGRSRSAAALLGSESEQVLMESRTPVLIVKRPGERAGLPQARGLSDERRLGLL